MRSIFAIMALPAFFFSSSLGNPVIDSKAAVIERDAATTAYSDVAALFTQIKPFTGAINATAATLTSNSPQAQKALAEQVFITNIKAITTAISSTDSQVLSLLSSPGKLKTRQTPAELQALGKLVEDLILEINGALQLVVDTIGLTQAILSSLQPLVKALSKLLLDLDKVIDGLLALVKNLVDGLLVGLSKALNGLVL